MKVSALLLLLLALLLGGSTHVAWGSGPTAPCVQVVAGVPVHGYGCRSDSELSVKSTNGKPSETRAYSWIVVQGDRCSVSDIQQACSEAAEVGAGRFDGQCTATFSEALNGFAIQLTDEQLHHFLRAYKHCARSVHADATLHLTSIPSSRPDGDPREIVYRSYGSGNGRAPGGDVGARHGRSLLHGTMSSVGDVVGVERRTWARRRLLDSGLADTAAAPAAWDADEAAADAASAGGVGGEEVISAQGQGSAAAPGVAASRPDQSTGLPAPQPRTGRAAAAGNGLQLDPEWGLDRLDQRALPLDGRFGYSNDGTGVHAYIVDTGIRRTHSDFGYSSGRAGSRADEAFAATIVGEHNEDCNGCVSTDI